jgi:hypothetical protein
MLTKEYLESKLVPELKEIAKKLGIKNYSKLKKAEIISVILKHPINKKGLVIKKDSEKKVKKVASEKKVKSAPKKKKSPGIIDQVKGLFFSEPKKKAAKKPKVEKKKRTSVKKVKSVSNSELRMLKEEAKENANLSQSALREKYASPKKTRKVKSSSGIFGIPAFKKSLLKKKASPQKYNFRGSPVY